MFPLIPAASVYLGAKAVKAVYDKVKNDAREKGYRKGYEEGYQNGEMKAQTELNKKKLNGR